MRCPCQSGKDYAQCCQLIIERNLPTKQCEQVMRARYSAHVLGHIDYIMQSCHPETRAQHDAKQIKAWCEQSEWLGLTILQHKSGLKKGEVEFIARYIHQGETVEHHEHSLFKKLKNHWYFYQGQ